MCSPCTRAAVGGACFLLVLGIPCDALVAAQKATSPATLSRVSQDYPLRTPIQETSDLDSFQSNERTGWPIAGASQSRAGHRELVDIASRH
jgi:hypothetical protein